jgi:hypothetical protein
MTRGTGRRRERRRGRRRKRRRKKKRSSPLALRVCAAHEPCSHERSGICGWSAAVADKALEAWQ